MKSYILLFIVICYFLFLIESNYVFYSSKKRSLMKAADNLTCEYNIVTMAEFKHLLDNSGFSETVLDAGEEVFDKADTAFWYSSEAHSLTGTLGTSGAIKAGFGIALLEKEIKEAVNDFIEAVKEEK